MRPRRIGGAQAEPGYASLRADKPDYERSHSLFVITQHDGQVASKGAGLTPANFGGRVKERMFMNSSGTKRFTAYWIFTALAALLFIVPGAGLLLRVPHFTKDMAGLGYPAYFLMILGTWKLLGALAIVAPSLPRLKEWAYAGMTFDLTSAAISRVVMGDSIIKIVAPLLVAAIVLLSWRLRPAERAYMNA